MTPTNSAPFVPPRCVFVTGPRGPGKSQWLEARIARVQAQRADVRCAVLLADERLTQTTRFANTVPAVDVRCIFMPCLCCPGSADLPRIVRRFAEASRADWLFIEIPALAAAGLLAEFDAVVGWPREVVVWLSREWSRARRARALSVFQTRLLDLADQWVEQPAAGSPEPQGAVPTLSLI